MSPFTLKQFTEDRRLLPSPSQRTALGVLTRQTQTTMSHELRHCLIGVAVDKDCKTSAKLFPADKLGTQPAASSSDEIMKCQ